MKASVVLPGIVVASTMLFASSQAATPTAVAWITAAETAGQISNQASEARRQADDLLRQARKAVKEGQFDQAEALIVQAEKTGVTYDAYQAKYGDTPTSLRKLAAEERARTGGARKPSSLFPALWNQPGQQPAAAPSPPQDPFAQRQSQEQALNQMTDGAKAQAASLLNEARAQLAKGDKFAALSAYQKAAGLRVQFGPDEDSPEKVAAAITAAGLDVSRVAPAAFNPTSPFIMNTAGMSEKDQNLPNLLPGMQAPPGGVNVAPQINPYALPMETNPLAQSGLPPATGRQATPEQLADLNLPAPREPGRPDEPPQRLPALPYAPPGQPSNAQAAVPNKPEALRLIAQARMALDKGDLNTAGQLAKQADGLRVPDDAFAPGETRPWQIVLEVDKAIYRRQGMQTASATEPVANDGPKYPVSPGVYNPAADNSRLQQASTSAAMLRQAPDSIGASHPAKMYEAGVKALEAQDRDTAIKLFQEAWKQKDQLDPEMQRQLGDKLTFLRANTAPAQPLPRPEGPGAPISPLEQVNSQQELSRQRLVREFLAEASAAQALAQTDPRGALAKIKAFRERVSAAEIDTTARKNLLTGVDRKAAELQTYIDQNKSTIDNAERNRDLLADRARSAELTSEMQNKMAQLVEQFNKLMDEQRYPEAEVIAKQAREIEPNSVITTAMVEKAALARNIAASQSIKERQTGGFQGALESVDESAIAFDDREPIVFNVRRWGELTRRRRSRAEMQNRLSPAEMEIQKSLGKPVEVKFTERPLSEVMTLLGQMTGVNIYLDPQGMRAEGLTSDAPVTLDLSQPISLKSALTLLLEPLNLSYVIQNEVLRITSQQTRDSNVYAKVYYVADLVVPIPNFTPTYNMGIAGALKESLASLGYGGGSGPLNRAPLTMAADTTQPPASMNPVVMAQQQQNSANGLFPTSSARQGGSLGSGPGGMGGGVQADFDPLIELITSTIEPDSWQDVGGPGSVSGFDTNLSLVVSQRQDIHERIADLLEQLRRLQDLQVTIEVRFITVSDRFFERIGIDFDFNIDDNTHLNSFADQIPTSQVAVPTSPFDDDGRSFAVGLTPNGPTADLDFRFGNGSFGASTPTFGGFDAGSAANFGFAILSDIEVFFLLQAAQGDDRTNVLQAPKVTLFNGQQATIIDSSFRPFVTSVVPVVGDFAAAHQPVIVVLSEGTMMSVQAVVSSDRRFVRLTLVPFFSQIGDVETFTFNGKVTTDSGTVVQDPANPDQTVTNGQTRTVEGTTVQLPTLATTTVTTTVSVPDGGTVLLGGIKRLREGRVERGLPLVSKIPYVSRLFTNVGIGRDAQSLMMMVTPRIIIQEEEEEKLGIDFEE
ncbi:Bacterial type II and III secretion system protein [Anatilimnocola aggregata]|uniref:Bacterial type II and III secretion system protein n=1 Tax=Anatilimnocola aggregata TaxID=2528021 RepID=A0A517Y4W5_9BACT|nr:general secretion pathway protein GspD [Anatilimnocola aggregata]QDU25291.1 Bacterial type II and III secretion system protein [Anatilimnocola aggregata]